MSWLAEGVINLRQHVSKPKPSHSTSVGHILNMSERWDSHLRNPNIDIDCHVLTLTSTVSCITVRNLELVVE